MESNRSKFINENNITDWLSALGFSFPRNEAEEKIFDKLYADYEFKLKNVKIDTKKLISELEEGDKKDDIVESEWKMAARNYGDLPKHIIEKMKKNQNGKEEVTKKIEVISKYLFNEYSVNNRVNLDKIAEDEGIIIHYDDYEDAFDGMFVIDSGIHHIHLNIASGNHKESGRGRFSLAHEFGHYLIEDHHEDILLGKLKPHPSFQNSQLNVYEQEADLFAASILMPQDIFYNCCGGQKFSWKLIERLSSIFGASKMAVLKRFIDTTKHELFIVATTVDGTIQWFDRNEEFPKMKHKFSRGQKVPQNALANNFKGEISEIVEAWPEDWFETWGGKSERQMFEQCYYAQAYERIITMLWFL